MKLDFISREVGAVGVGALSIDVTKPLRMAKQSKAKASTSRAQDLRSSSVIRWRRDFWFQRLPTYDVFFFSFRAAHCKAIGVARRRPKETRTTYIKSDRG